MKNAYILKLFVAGNDGKARKIYAGLSEILQGAMPGEHELELIDVLLNPDKAMEYGVFATPTLIKELPEPMRRVVGKLDDVESAVMAVGLVMNQAATPVPANIPRP
jgi:circadian clock protein KaiB